jgi:hypothetical protein
LPGIETTAEAKPPERSPGVTRVLVRSSGIGLPRNRSQDAGRVRSAKVGLRGASAQVSAAVERPATDDARSRLHISGDWTDRYGIVVPPGQGWAGPLR